MNESSAGRKGRGAGFDLRGPVISGPGLGLVPAEAPANGPAGFRNHQKHSCHCLSRSLLRALVSHRSSGVLCCVPAVPHDP